MSGTGGSGGSGIVLVAYSSYKPGTSSIEFDGTGDYLSVPDSADWDFGTGDFTFESWVNVDSHHANEDVFFALATGPANLMFRVDDPGGSSVLKMNLMGSDYSVSHTLSVDTWYHVACVRDSGSLKFFVDGVQSGASQSATDDVSVGYALLVGGRTDVGRYLDGYMDEIRISNSARYSATFTPSTTPFTADVNTKLLIHSAWTGLIGADSSGNSNDFTVSNLTATNKMIDTPTSNWCTLNPLQTSRTSGVTLLQGNLRLSSNDYYLGAISTIAVNSGKWYWELCNVTTDYFQTGFSTIKDFKTVTGLDYAQGQYIYKGSYSAFLNGYGTLSVSGGSNTLTTESDGDILQFALDLENGRFYIGKNGTWSNSSNPVTGTNYFYGDWYTAGNYYSPMTTNGPTANQIYNFGQDSSFAGNETAQGNQDDNSVGDFYYDVPAGYLALCTDNLSDPEIALPGENFNSIIWSGESGNPARDFTGVGFQPDLVWVKGRNDTWQNLLSDSVRGSNKIIYSDTTAAEVTDANNGYLDSFDSDGFSTVEGSSNNGQYNGDGDTFVGWNWKAGGAPTADNSAGAGATPTAGSVKIDGSNLGSALAGTIPATKLSANTTSGFSIVSYTGNETVTQTVAHGLSTAPSMVIVKNLGYTTEWAVGSDGETSWSYYLYLNDDRAETSASSVFGNAPDASVFKIGDATATNGDYDYMSLIVFQI